MKKKSDDGRFRYLYWVIIAIFAILVCRLAYLQLVEGEYYHSLAEGSCTTATARFSSARGPASW